MPNSESRNPTTSFGLTEKGIESLRKQLTCVPAWPRVMPDAAMVDELCDMALSALRVSEKAKPESEEAKALIADAARYRWLKNAADVDVMDEILMQKIEEWDSLIDTQIAFDGVVPVRPERADERSSG